MSAQQIYRLKLGSHVEIGRSLLLELRDGKFGLFPNTPITTEKVVFCRGSFWRYNPLEGVWRAIEDHEVEKTIHAFDGTRLGEKMDGDTVKLTQGMIKGITKCAMAKAMAPDFFDKAPAVIVFKNGTLDVCHGACKFREHRPADHAWFRLPIDYPEKPAAPLFAKALKSWFELDNDGEAKAECLQEFVGIALAGQAVSFQTALILHGDGATGKSTLLTIIRALFPRETTTAIPIHQMESPYNRSRLAKSRLNICSELSAADVEASESFKALITGDLVEARPIYQAPFSFLPAGAHLFACNVLPHVQDSSEGFWRRLLILTFNRRFKDADAIQELGAAIAASELAGVVSWALAGAERALARGRFIHPPSSLQARDDWRMDSDQVAQFVRDCVVKVEGPTTPAMEAYSTYEQWAHAHGHKPLASNKFSTRMRALGYGPTRRNDGNYYPLTFRPGPA